MKRYLVLSGGGSSGILAHAAALDTLVALGVEIVRIGGSSAGAVVAAVHAAQPDRPVLPVAQRLLVRTEPIAERDLELVPPSYYGNRQLMRTFRELLPERMGAVQVPLQVVTANLDTRAQQIWDSETHPDALLVPRVVASMSVPGIFPPVVLDRDLHVDGGLTSNVPAYDLYGDHPAILVLRIVRRGPPARLDRDSISDYLAGIVETMMRHAEEADLRHAEGVQVIELPITGPTVDFTVPAARARELAASASAAVSQWWSVGRGENR